MENFEQYIGKWANIRWNFDAGQGNAPLEDKIKLGEFNGVIIAKIEGVANGYLKLNYFDELQLLLSPFSLTPVPEPKFKIRNVVEVDGARHSAFKSTIDSIVWHYKEKCFYYLLDGKKKRFSEMDLKLSF